MAFFTIILAFLHYRIKAEITTLIIGLALFFAGVMDALHVLAAGFDALHLKDGKIIERHRPGKRSHPIFP